MISQLFEMLLMKIQKMDNDKSIIKIYAFIRSHKATLFEYTYVLFSTMFAIRLESSGYI